MRCNTPRCPFCYENVRGRASHKGHRGFHSKRAATETVSDMLKKRGGGDGKGPHVDPLFVNEELAGYSELAEFLLCSSWPEDGSPRVTGTVLLFGDGSNLKAMLNDRDQSLVAFLTIDAAEGILAALEAAVVSSATDWRPAKKYPGGSRK